MSMGNAKGCCVLCNMKVFIENNAEYQCRFFNKKSTLDNSGFHKQQRGVDACEASNAVPQSA
ncbi:hypothetical protein DSLASN_05450 [Desulfoluna limicola]|uniref:Uncharacterized protein n=1 Tax=Desulfoluna limicola TaxID=2810562 RepID=A0ABN6EX40_9BACT|nr:hypothetical protein DSLASN_05450 [Desulfoluna limicola]